jgi:hypothetical protein
VFALALHSIVPNDTQESVLKSTSPSDPNTNPHAAVLTTNALNLNLLKSLAARAALDASVGARHVGVVIAFPPAFIDALVDHARRCTHRDPLVAVVAVVVQPCRELPLKHHVRAVSLCVTEAAADDDDDDDATACDIKDAADRRIAAPSVRRRAFASDASKVARSRARSCAQPKSVIRLD